MALSLALIFLLHPLDSQVVYAIPSMQDALFFFFGILALWIAFRYKSLKSLAFVSLCLFLSLLSKETGILFVIMVLLYFFWFNRKRLYPFIAFTVLPLAVYLMLKINAVGLDTRTTNSPIDHLSLVDRLLTMPSIVLFYLTKFVFPWKLASAYYWVYASYSFRHVLLPLIIDLIVIALVIYLSILIKKRAPKAQYRVFLFFTVWVTIGILAHLQIVPLDFTASEPWFYFSMAGVLGMTGLSIKTLVPRRYLHQQGRLLTILVCILIVLLGFRSAIRGSDWRNQYTLAIHDITASKEDFNAYDALTLHYYNLRQYKEAVYYGTKSTSIYSNGVDNNNLGRALMGLGNYAGAYKLFHKGLQSQDYYPIYDNLAVLTIYYGSPNADKQYLLHFAGRYPSDPIPWYCLAILEYTKLNNDVEARTAITRAYAIAPSDETVLSFSWYLWGQEYLF